MICGTVLLIVLGLATTPTVTCRTTASPRSGLIPSTPMHPPAIP